MCLKMLCDRLVVCGRFFVGHSPYSDSADPSFSQGTRRKITWTNLLRSSCINSGSVPLKARISLRMISQPLPRCSMKPVAAMKWAWIRFWNAG